MTRVAFPALIVVVTVAAFVGAAGWNRSGEPPLAIVLTERELPVAYIDAAPGDPGKRLRIAYEYRHDPLDARNWLPESRLREIGFAFNVPVGSPQAVDTYRRVPPRLAWVVFEYDGLQWRDIERRRAMAETAREPVTTLLPSRLVPVDAGPDLELLRARYPAGHLILRGVIGLSYVPASRGGPLLHGVLREVVPSAIAVPYELRPLLDQLTPAGHSAGPEPRYEADLAVGRLGLPYVRSLRSPARN